MNKKLSEIMINNSKFKTLSGENISTTDKGLEKLGYIWAPYISVPVSDEKSSEYDEFMKEYEKLHKFCPKCGGENYSVTFVGYPLDLKKKDKYKDLNTCVCSECGDKHIVHDRIPLK